MKTITVPATLEHLEEVVAFVEKELIQLEVSSSIQVQIDVAIEEIFVNIASYAYHPVEGQAEVRCEVLQDPLRIEIQFLDSGVPFDPLARGEADLSEEAIMERTGGLGIHYVKKTMDDVQYSYENGKNILTIQKKL